MRKKKRTRNMAGALETKLLGMRERKEVNIWAKTESRVCCTT